MNKQVEGIILNKNGVEVRTLKDWTDFFGELHLLRTASSYKPKHEF